MGKKTRNMELVAIRTLREQKWTYEAWRQRLSHTDMRRHSALSPAEGGLGYELSESQLNALDSEATRARGARLAQQQENPVLPGVSLWAILGSNQ